MRIDERFILRKIAGEYMVVPTGEKAGNCNGLILLNASGVFLWDCLQEECTLEELAGQMREEYEASEEIVRRDLEQFLEKMKTIGCLEDTDA